MIFFSKKYYLVDIIDRAFDIHNHFLPGIDDGSIDLETSRELLQIYWELGFNGILCTPHIMQGFYNNDTLKIQQTLKDTQAQLAALIPNFSISAAAEYMVDAHFEDLIKADDLLLMPNRHILIEQSYAFPALQFDQVVFHLKTKNIQPIFAHPERYNYLKKLSDYAPFRCSCKLQLNALSLGLHYGKAIRQKAFQLLEDGAYDFIGTDAHRPEHLHKLKEITLSKKHLDLVRTLWQNNEALRF